MPRKLKLAGEWDDCILRQFPANRRYLVGVSGGRDSVALLHWLLTKGYQKLVVCHFDHQLRGRSSAADARFVERLATAHGLKFFGDAAEVAALAQSTKRSIETAARDARYQFFARAARRFRCETLFLAHHADDLVETFLMNLFRGSAGRAMQPVSVHSLGKTELTVVRPLLQVWREEIDGYVRSAHLKFREDPSNAKLDRTRNRMRHKIIPALEKEFGRAIRKSVWRAAMVASEEDRLLESMIPAPVEKLSLRSLGKQALPLQRRAVRNWLRHHEVADVGFDLVEDVRSLLDANARRAKINLPRNRHARRRVGELFIE